jgi:hypothetical protein
MVLQYPDHGGFFTMAVVASQYEENEQKFMKRTSSFFKKCIWCLPFARHCSVLGDENQ